MTRFWTRFITTLYADPRIRIAGLTLYYLAIIAAVLLLASRGSSVAPKFIYQTF